MLSPLHQGREACQHQERKRSGGSTEPGSQNGEKKDEKWAKAQRETPTHNLVHSIPISIEHLLAARHLCRPWGSSVKGEVEIPALIELVQERDDKQDKQHSYYIISDSTTGKN